MEPIYLLSLASRKSEWLAARQATVASNIANANTPGYKAKDLAAFADVLNQTQLSLSYTNPNHLTPGGSSSIDPVKEQKDSWEVSESGNSVGLEEELLKAGEVNRDYSLTTNIVKSFHSMLMAAVKE
jgi:flagellar basal-body rod protein FlgB